MMSRTVRRTNPQYDRRGVVRDGQSVRKPDGNDCPWCTGNRLHRHRRRIAATDARLREAELDGRL